MFGNSAAVFPMQMCGIDVIAVPTTLLSNRRDYPTVRGSILDADLVADLLVGDRGTEAQLTPARLFYQATSVRRRSPDLCWNSS